MNIRELIDKLNYYTKSYDEGKSLISDEEWDNLYFKLVELERKTGIYYKDSPTQQINYQVVNELKKIKHSHSMLSLNKTKNINDIKNFIGDKKCIAMAKMDGLTCSLTYHKGFLTRAETRGNGEIGEDILHNAIVIKSIPNRIKYVEDLVIDGEIICTYKDFENFSEEYKNPRNFAAGSIRLLNSKECEKRNLQFIAWDVIKGFDNENFLSNKLRKIEELGFIIVPFDINSINYEKIKEEVQRFSYPIDGIVYKFNDINYGKSLGKTTHHFKNALAYKFYDENYLTKLLDIEWTMGRTGQLCPVALFETLNINGTEISRASLSNISIMKQTLGEHPFVGQVIEISKRNQIIPKVERAKNEKGEWICSEGVFKND